MLYSSCTIFNRGGFSMKKICIVFLFMCVMCNYCHSSELLYPQMPDKGHPLACADKARRIANTHLLKAQLLIDNLSDFKDVLSLDRLRNAIGYAICSIAIPDPRAKILAVGLSVFADVVTNPGIDKIQDMIEIHKELSNATIALEHYNYFCRMYFEGKKYNWDYNGGTPYFLVNCAIGELIKADIMTTQLSHRVTGCVLSNYIMKIRNDLMQDMIATGKLNWRKINSTYLPELESFLENFNEIAEASYGKNDESQNDLKKKIWENLDRARSNIDEAECMWRMDRYNED